jgi:hypothetical protein
MTSLAVLETVGIPDFMKHNEWEYDFYGENDTPYSVCLNWAKVKWNRVHKEPSRLVEIKKLGWTKKRLTSRLAQVVWSF